ncbi:MAG: acyltransferase family protein, partial [Erysipelotrichaceae bacterium]
MTKKHYPQLDIVKYIAALLVICAHVYKIFENPVLNYTVVSVFARLAVPFFFSSAAYMVACKRHNPGYIKRYLVNLTLTYLIFSLLYLPFGIRFVFETVGTAWWLVPLTFLGGFFYAGTYYHLWFIPGIITALLLMEWLLKRFSLKTIFWIATGLYLIGSYETYYYVWANPILQSGFDALLSLFVTTRNGLFLGLFFVWVGYAIALHPKKIK